MFEKFQVNAEEMVAPKSQYWTKVIRVINPSEKTEG